MKVSIITVCLNSINGLKKTLNSVSQQSYKNIEHIIIDGGSIDGSVEFLKNQKNIFFISEPDQGLYDAMNKGISFASGKIIGFLNSDDIYYDKFVVQNIVDKFKFNIDGVYGSIVYVDKNNNIKRKWKVLGNYSKGDFLKGWHPPHPSFYVKKELLDKNKFNTKLSVCADYELMLKLFEKKNTRWVNMNLYMVRFSCGGISNNSYRRIINSFLIYKILKQNGYKQSYLKFIFCRYFCKLLELKIF